MKRFEDLTRGGQVRRMRRMAETALAAYDLGEVHLTPLAHFFNTTFRVDAQPWQDNADLDMERGEKQRYVVRIHRPGTQDATTIRSELVWLLALKRETELVVPEPVPNRRGELVTLAATDGVPQARNCVVLRWVEGRFLRARLEELKLEQVGQFMASMHNFAQHYEIPGGFVRKRWDYEGVRNGVLGTDLEQSWAHLTREDRKLLDAVGEHVRLAMQALGEEREVFGLIHADFYEGNYLFCNGNIHAIDFDGCGWGHYLFDIGVTFSTLLARSDYMALRQAFLRGYRRVRAFSAQHEALIDTFIAARLLCHVLWLAAHVDEPSYGARATRRIQYELGELQALLTHMGE